MNMKKIMAGVVASALAVSTMAVAAFADALMTKTGNESSAELYDVDFTGLTEEQVSSITKIEAKVSVTTDMVNGCIGYNNAADGKWTAVNNETKGDAPASSTWVAEFEAGALAAKDEDGALAPFAQVQFWWVNPSYDEDGNEGDPGTATLESVTLYDAAGNVVAPAAAGGATGGTTGGTTDNEGDGEGETTTAPDNGNTSTPTEDKNTPDTGVEGVAVVAGLAIVAAGAVVVAKKRK